MPVRVTVHPVEDVELSDGVPPAAFREPLAALVRRPELRHATLLADGAPVPEDCRAGERPLLPGATLTIPRQDSRTRPDDAAMLRTPWVLARTTGTAAGALVPVGGPRDLVRGARRLIGTHPDRAPAGEERGRRGDRLGLRRGGAGPRPRFRARLRRAGLRHGWARLRLRRGGAARILAPPRPSADLTWGLSLLPVLASVGLAVLLRQPVLALFALVGLAALLPQVFRRRVATGAAPGAAGRARAHRAGPDALLAFATAAHQTAPGTWRAARAAWTRTDVPPGWPGGAWDELLGDGSLAVVGPAEPARAVARAIVADLAARGRPVQVLGAVHHWTWCRWLPAPATRASGPALPGDTAVLRLPDAPGALQLPDGSADDHTGAPVLVVDHGTPADHATARGAIARGAIAVILGTTRGCRTVVTVRDDRLHVAGPEIGRRTRPLVGVTTEWAERYARRLAGARHLGRTMSTLTGSTTGPPITAANLPDDVPLGSLHELDGLAAGRTGRRSGTWAIPLGRTTTGTVTWDLVADGPHLLVAGTTGSGKSELLRALVLGLALQHPPGHLMLGLVDFKGGAGLGTLTGLPHVVGQVTDLDATLAARALTGLQAELRRRKTILADQGVADVTALAPGTVPRLVVVVDEFRALADDLPELLPGLVRIAAQGRSLGVHLVLATQRPAGAVSADVRANVTARLALRVTDPLESRDVVDCPDAADLPVNRPGRAILRIGSGPPAVLQCAHTGPGRPAVPVRRAVPFGRTRGDRAGIGRPERSPERSAEGSADLVAAIRTAYGEPAPHAPLWLPPLPERATPADLTDCDDHPDAPGLLLALGDLPDQQRRTAIRWNPADGNLAVLGRTRSGRTTALATLAAAARAHGMTVRTITPASASAPAPEPDLLLVDDLDAIRATHPGWEPPPGVPVAVATRNPAAAHACGAGPRLVMLSRDRADDLALGAPAALAGSGGVPGRAAWCGRTGAVLCQTVLAGTVT